MSDFLETIKARPLVTYGAVGSLLVDRGFDMTGCLGKWLLDNPDQLDWFTGQYLEAGCHILASAGSQCGPWKLKPWGLEDRVIELNRRVTERVKALLPEGHFLLGSILPTGRMLRPLGDLDPQMLYEAYRDEVVGYVQGGADIIWIMTMTDLEEAVIGVRAAKDFSNLPVMAAMAFDNTPKGPRTVMGVDPKTAAIRLSEAGADVIGHNCGGADPGSVDRILDEMRLVTDKPLVAKPNAGMPVLVDGKTQWPETPQAFAAAAATWVKSGARVVGGCCGSTPAHAAAISRAVEDM
jgi:5-methyltetrahydrofolate--homocysteine methyltransferase